MANGLLWRFVTVLAHGDSWGEEEENQARSDLRESFDTMRE